MKKYLQSTLFGLLAVAFLSAAALGTIKATEDTNTATTSATPRYLKTEYVTQLREQLTNAREIMKTALKVYTNAREDSKKATALKSYAQKIIENRLSHLQKMIERLEGSGLTEDQKSEIRTNLQMSYNGLQALENEITDDMTLEQLKDLVRRVYGNYHVYALELPRNTGLQASAWLSSLVNQKLNPMLPRLENRIKKLQDAGKDTAALEELVTQIKDKETEIKTFLSAAQDAFRSINPAGDLETQRAQLELGKQKMQEAKTKLTELSTLLTQLSEELKALEAE